ncbi:MAG: helix-hairpin-helix domain-containing protein [Roseiarcus sp.]
MAPPPAGLQPNAVLAGNLREYADLLRQQGAEGFRVAAYERAAGVVDALDRPLDAVFAAEGRDGLTALPGVGRSIAAALAEMLATGRWAQLERLRGALEPEKLFLTIPGLGEELAKRIFETLHVETLEALETAAHDGRLAGVEGIGPRRAEMIRTALAERLGRPRLRRLRQTGERPPVAMLIDVDRDYRDKAAAGVLRKIAPKRFNPNAEAWLPVLHATRGAWRFTVIFSNTGLAHELGRVKDWVVIYYETDAQPEGQCTVVTETRGPLAGRRVVRGREDECRDFWLKEEARGPSAA